MGRFFFIWIKLYCGVFTPATILIHHPTSTIVQWWRILFWITCWMLSSYLQVYLRNFLYSTAASGGSSLLVDTTSVQLFLFSLFFTLHGNTYRGSTFCTVPLQDILVLPSSSLSCKHTSLAPPLSPVLSLFAASNCRLTKNGWLSPWS